MQLLPRPFSTLLSYLLISLVGHVLAFARRRPPAYAWRGTVLPVLGWVRVAQVYSPLRPSAAQP